MQFLNYPGEQIGEQILQNNRLYFVEPSYNDSLNLNNTPLSDLLATNTPNTAECKQFSKFDELFIKPKNNYMPICTKILLGILVVFLMYKLFCMCKNNVEKLTVQEINFNGKKKI